MTSRRDLLGAATAGYALAAGGLMAAPPGLAAAGNVPSTVKTFEPRRCNFPQPLTSLRL